MVGFCRTHPFLSKIKARSLLSGDSSKRVYHIVLDLQGSGLSYKVGDSIGVFSNNPRARVDRLLQAWRQSGETVVVDPWSSSEMHLRDFLIARVDLSRMTPSLLRRLHLYDAPSTEKSLFYAQECDIIDLFASRSVRDLSLQEVLPLFFPLHPRLYSVASSQTRSEEEVALLVATLTYRRGERICEGVASHFLCERARVGETLIPVYVQPHPAFTLPDDMSVPIVMIGSGTGVAPYRGFLEERKERGARGKNWLIFGGRKEETGFYYGKFFTDLVEEGALELDTAFSRDQEEKIYVQHRLFEKGKRLWNWLEAGACIYICGDARYMAKEVMATLCRVLETEGGYTPDRAREYVRALRRSSRLFVNVY